MVGCGMRLFGAATDLMEELLGLCGGEDAVRLLCEPRCLDEVSLLVCGAGLGQKERRLVSRVVHETVVEEGEEQQEGFPGIRVKGVERPKLPSLSATEILGGDRILLDGARESKREGAI